MRRTGFLIWKELIELRRDPRLFSIVILAPILQLFMLAYAATTDIRDVPVVITDGDRSAASRELTERFNASPSFKLVAVTTSTNDVDRYLERGDAWLAVTIPAGYDDAIAAGGSAAVQIIADGSDANSAGVSLGYATNLIAAYGQELTARRMVHGAVAGLVTRVGSLEPRVRVWFNPRLQS